MKTKLAFSFIVLLLVGCTNVSHPTSSGAIQKIVYLNEKFYVVPNETAVVNGHGINITYLGDIQRMCPDKCPVLSKYLFETNTKNFIKEIEGGGKIDLPDYTIYIQGREFIVTLNGSNIRPISIINRQSSEPEYATLVKEYLEGKIGQKFLTSFEVHGYGSAFNWAISGNLPEGLYLKPDVIDPKKILAMCNNDPNRAECQSFVNTGVIHIQGIPKKEGDYNFELVVKDNLRNSATEKITIRISN